MTDTPSIRDLLVGLAADEILVGDGEDTPYGYQETGRLWRVCAPKPVPAPPATERVPWHEGMGRIAQAPNDGDWFTIDTVRCDYILGGPVVEGDRCTLPADDDGMVEVLVDPAPTGDDEPADDANAREHRERTQADTALMALQMQTDAWRGDDEPQVCPQCGEYIYEGVCLCEPQADTPAPQGRWTVEDAYQKVQDEHGTLGAIHYLIASVDQQGSGDAFRDLLARDLDLVRRDGTAPTPEQVRDWLTRTGLDDRPTPSMRQIGWVLDAVRALRDGGTR